MKKEIIEQLSVLITSAFGLVAALAWNSAIQQIFIDVLGRASGLWYMIGYAVLVTIIAVIVTIVIGKIAAKAK